MQRLYLDSNVWLNGLLSRWGVAKAVLIICAAEVCRLVTSQYVLDEVETALLRAADDMPQARASQLLGDYDRFVRMTRPEIAPAATAGEVLKHAHLIRHLHDVPVLVSAMKAQPDYLLSLNEKHFNQQVAARTGLRIGTPLDFLEAHF
jgi:predicted nucleic acid-binding protein